jgi:hypothetical protein
MSAIYQTDDVLEMLMKKQYSEDDDGEELLSDLEKHLPKMNNFS